LDTPEGIRGVSRLAEAADPLSVAAAKGELVNKLGMKPNDADALHDMIVKYRTEPRAEAVAVGAGSREYADPANAYFPANVVKGAYPSDFTAATKPGLGVFSGDKLSRSPETYGISDRTNTLREMYSHPDLNAMANGGAVKKELAGKIGELFGDRIPETYFTAKQMNKLAGYAEKHNLALSELMGNAPALEQATDELKLTARNRYNRLANVFLKTPEEARKLGLYADDPAYAIEQMVSNPLLHAAKADFLAKRLAMPDALIEGGRDTVAAFTRKLGLKFGDETAGFGKTILEASNQPVTQDALNALKKRTIAPALAKSLSAATGFGKQPESVGKLVGGFDSVTNLFKSGVTAFPAFVARNLGGMAVKSWQTDMGTPATTMDALKMLFGKSSARLVDDPAVIRRAAEMGIAPAKLTPQVAGDIYSTLMHEVGTVGDFGIASSTSSGRMSGAEPIIPRTLSDYHGSYPGALPGKTQTYGTQFNLGDIAKQLVGKKDASGRGTTWVPWKAKARGVLGETESTFAPFKAVQTANSLAEDQSRLADVMRLTGEGYNPAVAADLMKTAKFRYDPGSFTPFEKKVMKRLIPFWAHTKQATADTIRTLAENPGGKLGQIIKTTGQSSNVGDITLPDYLKQSLTIPIPEGTPLIGPEPGGDPRYLTGFGLMHENDPFGFLGGPGLQGMGLEALSRMNPLIKGPIEAATGVSAFQRGPAGPRALEDQDPLLGRLIQNVADSANSYVTGQPVRTRDPIRFPGLQTIESVVGNSPISRLLSTARTLSDPRKSWSAAALNTLTGARVTDVSQRSQEGQVGQELRALMKAAGAKDFENVYFSKAQLADMSPDQQMAAMRMQALKNMMAKRQRDRAKAAAQ
jgi:hypothetical protein